jgi:hypothetical protein
LDLILLAPIAATGYQLHRHDARHAKFLALRRRKPIMRGGLPPQLLDQNTGIQEEHLYGAVPGGLAEMTGKQGAVPDIGAIRPNPGELRRGEIAQGRTA